MIHESVIVYDGDCPFCSRYVALVRLREAVGPVRLVNARDGGPETQRLRSKGYDLNEGMILIQGDKIHYGEDCINRLALLSTPSGAFNRINSAIFSSPLASKILYPVLKMGRRLTLILLRRKRLEESS
jgi:predicted DCC family thiol-disulfide oxidoreductase YuxK